MGLIKRDRLEEKGSITLNKAQKLSEPKKVLPPPVVSQATVPINIAGSDISKVKTEAQKIVNKAIQEAESIRKEARESGKEEGRAEAASRIEEAMETLNDAVKERKKIIKDAEPEILRLSLKVAEQIIRSEVSLHRDVCLNIVAEAIARVSDREQIIIRVNREDSEYLKRYKDRLTGLLDGVKSFSIIEDATIEPGGCVIETNLGFIDSKISTKLKSIEEALIKVSSEDEKEDAPAAKKQPVIDIRPEEKPLQEEAEDPEEDVEREEDFEEDEDFEDEEEEEDDDDDDDFEDEEEDDDDEDL